MLFSRLKQWEEAADRPPPRTVTVDPHEAAPRLDRLTGRAEARARASARWPKQSPRCSRPSMPKARPTCCWPRPARGSARRSPISRRPRCGPSRPGGTVWVSTFTKALQRQLDGEGHKLFADPEGAGATKIVVRKGRENYLCLLNLEDALQGAFAGRAAILAQLVGRWAAYSKDGDMVGGDLPGWLPSLFRRAGAAALDRPARRVRLCRLPALSPLLHRARRAGEPRGRHRHRQPRVGDGQCRARARGRAGADPVRRGPSSVRRRRFDLRGGVRRAGSDRDAALDRRAGRALARPAARAGGAADGRRLL